MRLLHFIYVYTCTCIITHIMKGTEVLTLGAVLMSRFAVTFPRNPTGPILHTITKLHCYCKHSVLCIG